MTVKFPVIAAVKSSDPASGTVANPTPVGLGQTITCTITVTPTPDWRPRTRCR